MEWFITPWPWYVSGPLLGLFVPILLLLGNKQLGLSSSLRAVCAATLPANLEFFKYDWRTSGLWNIALALGILAGAAIVCATIGVPTPAIAEQTRDALIALDVHRVAGLVPDEVFSWQSLGTFRGAVCVLGGGFLVGFGAAYGGGCTSGHGILGLASLQKASFVALTSIFGAGVLATFVLMPLIF